MLKKIIISKLQIECYYRNTKESNSKFLAKGIQLWNNRHNQNNALIALSSPFPVVCLIFQHENIL